MKTQSKYAPPLTVAEYAAYEANIRVLRTMAHRPDCTPLVENSDPAGVALGGNDGQGVCALSDYPASSVADYRASREAVEYALSLSWESHVAARVWSLAQDGLLASFEQKRDCGYLLFLH